MASLYKQKNSVYWWLCYKKDGKWKRDSTGLRYTDAEETIRAKKLRATWEATELEVAQRCQDWDWVPDFFTTSGIMPRTLACYTTRWKNVQVFLNEKRLTPQDIKYTSAETYRHWRLKFAAQKGGRPAIHNTIVQEVRLLAYVLDECVRREILKSSPLSKLRMKSGPSKIKPAFTDAEISQCLAALEARPAWMRTSFLIALHTGCRLRETSIPMHCINLKSTPPTITFPNPKGGSGKSFTVPMPTALRPLLETLKSAGAAATCTLPGGPSVMWRKFFDQQNFPHLSFHGLRVTKVTRLRREGVPREIAMRLVNHSSEMVHLMYDRHQVADLAAYADAGGPGSGGSCATVQSPTKIPPRLLPENP